MQRCEIHNIALQAEEAVITYGLVVEPFEKVRAELKSFPNARSLNLGGCVVGEETHRTVQFCHQCRKVEREWNASYAVIRPAIEAFQEREMRKAEEMSERGHHLTTEEIRRDALEVSLALMPHMVVVYGTTSPDELASLLAEPCEALVAAILGSRGHPT